jgi:hypothetical protein
MVQKCRVYHACLTQDVHSSILDSTSLGVCFKIFSWKKLCLAVKGNYINAVFIWFSSVVVIMLVLNTTCHYFNPGLNKFSNQFLIFHERNWGSLVCETSVITNTLLNNMKTMKWGHVVFKTSVITTTLLNHMKTA